MLTVPPAVAHSVSVLMLSGLPSTLTFPPSAPATADVVAGVPVSLELDFLSSEQPEIPATTVAAAAIAMVTSRFNCAPLPVWRSSDDGGPSAQYAGFAKPHQSSSGNCFARLTIRHATRPCGQRRVDAEVLPVGHQPSTTVIESAQGSHSPPFDDTTDFDK